MVNMNVNLIYPSKYLKAADLGERQVTVTIKSAAMEDLGYGAEKERKLVIYFERATKGLILNRTNAMIIASMYTPETDNWVGNAIILYSARVKAFGAWHDAVRVKEQIPPRNVGAARVPDAMLEQPPIDDEDDLLDVDEGQEARQIDASTGEITGDNPFDDAHPVEPEKPPRRVIDIQWLTGKPYDFVEWVAKLHAKSNGPCTVAQYGFLVGIIDELTNNQHGYILSLLCQSEISKSNMPGHKVADKLLELLTPTIKVEGDDTLQEIVNPNYRPDLATMISDLQQVPA